MAWYAILMIFHIVYYGLCCKRHGWTHCIHDFYSTNGCVWGYLQQVFFSFQRYETHTIKKHFPVLAFHLIYNFFWCDCSLSSKFYYELCPLQIKTNVRLIRSYIHRALPNCISQTRHEKMVIFASWKDGYLMFAKPYFLALQ